VDQVARIELSNPDKVLFPADGLTKADLAAYYESVAEWMVPHVRDRPLNLWRWNTGIDGRLVVQQDIPKGAPDWVKRVETPRRKGGSIEHVLCQDADTLRWLANQNCITPHVWSARRDRLDRPDHIVFDFDPEAGSDFALVREGALLAGERLRELGLEPFAMVTGSKGIHVIAPIKRTRDAAWVRERAGELGVEIAERSPDTLTTEWRKEKRDGKILVDTARNTYGQTVVAPYAVRALEGAPVATPLVWEELSDPELSARSWTLRTVGDRLAERGDPWAGLADHAAALPG
jgi:bifunctional non-homologous end joining protein LigD